MSKNNNYQDSFEAQRSAILKKLYETHKEKVEEKKKKAAMELQAKFKNKYTQKKKSSAAAGSSAEPAKEKEESYSSQSFSASGKMAVNRKINILSVIFMPTTKRIFYQVLNNLALYSKTETSKIADIIQLVKHGNLDLIILEESDNYDESNTYDLYNNIRDIEIENNLNSCPIMVLKKTEIGIYDTEISSEKSIFSINLMQENIIDEMKKKIVPVINKNLYYNISRNIQVEWSDEVVTIYFTNNLSMDDAIKLKKYLSTEEIITKLKNAFSININLYSCEKMPAIAIGLLLNLHKTYEMVVFYLTMKETQVNEALSQFDDLNINIL